MEFMTRQEVIRLREGTLEEGWGIINESLSRVYNKAVEDTLRRTPDLMLKLFVSQQAQAKMKQNFYDRNPDFKEYQKIVQNTIQEVESMNPGKTYDFILGLAEPMIRSRINTYKELLKLPTGKVNECNQIDNQ